jgi:hypothetical protein
MKEIQPKQIWVNGLEYTASVMLYNGTYDNQTSQCEFYFALYMGSVEQTTMLLASGNLYMEQPDYDEYNSSTDSAAFAQNWVCNKLGVTII